MYLTPGMHPVLWHACRNPNHCSFGETSLTALSSAMLKGPTLLRAAGRCGQILCTGGASEVGWRRGYSGTKPMEYLLME